MSDSLLKDFQLNDKQKTQLLDFVAQKTGMVFAARLHEWVGKQFFTVLKKHNESFSENLISDLSRGLKAKLCQDIFDNLTVNETMFFRDKKYFAFMEEFMFPDLIKKNNASKTLSIWIAAGSSGQEIYSIQFMLLKKFPELKNWRLNIYSTDLSSEIIEKAKKAVYDINEVSRGLSEVEIKQYFDEIESDKFQLKNEYKQNIRFMASNLKEDFSSKVPNVDFISCRNVLIYFDKDTKADIIKRLLKKLNPGGYLILGQVDYIGYKDYPEGIEYKVENLFPYFKKITTN